MSSSLDAEDLIFYSDDNNNIYSGGFKVNSILMKNGSSPIITLNQNGGEKMDNVSDLFQNLVVPNWSFTLPCKKSFIKQKEIVDEEEDNELIDEDLHNKLLLLIAPNSTQTKMKIKIKTKKNKNKNHLLTSLKKNNKTKKK
jgi:hypothetical protein